MKSSDRYEKVKRGFDKSFAGFCLFCSIPLWGLIPLLIWLEDRGPIFFEQKRVGKDQSLFLLYKFRSMIPDAEMAGIPVMAASKDPRITRVGYWLRKTAMDELPQLI
ncbi:MAG: sugar transferase, partial [Nitrospiria bacterium]